MMTQPIISARRIAKVLLGLSLLLQLASMVRHRQPKKPGSEL